jgi:ABC-2 type transport system ATP-binding protein
MCRAHSIHEKADTGGEGRGLPFEVPFGVGVSVSRVPKSMHPDRSVQPVVWGQSQEPVQRVVGSRIAGHVAREEALRAFVRPLEACSNLAEVALALTISGLSKTYPNGVKALKNLSLSVGNSMFGLVGPNGAGKSSLMRTIATLQDPDSGSISLDGIDVLRQKDQVRRILGYLPQEFGVYPKISALDMLHHLAVMKGMTSSSERKETVDALLQQTNLWDVRKKALSTFSGGMKQRFGIAQALLGNPRLIIVDEPTAGLDPAERNRFLNLLSSLGSDRTVILSTHIVDDVRQLCPRMAIIASGEVLLEGAPSEALAALNGRIWSKVVATAEEVRTVEAQLHVVSTHLVGGQHEIRVYADTPPSDGFNPVESDLEDVYFLNLSHQSKAQLPN